MSSENRAKFYNLSDARSSGFEEGKNCEIYSSKYINRHLLFNNSLLMNLEFCTNFIFEYMFFVKQGLGKTAKQLLAFSIPIV